jgi:uncharacterized protein DUF2188
MVWTRNKYPSSMKNLDSQTREKAIEIANALLDEHYEKASAARIAIVQAKKWAESDYPNARQYLFHVLPHPEGWAVRRANSAKACFVFDSMSEAQYIAFEISQQEHVGIIIHSADGAIQDPTGSYHDYESAVL